MSDIKNMPTKIHNFMGGEFITPRADAWLENFDPATGEVYALLPDSEAVDVVFAVQAANKAFLKWSERPARERAQYLHRIADLMEQKADLLAEIESRDVGKPLWLAREVDIPRAIQNFRYFAALINGEGTLAGDFHGRAMQYTLRSPLGVAALISPWNLPLYTLTFKIAPCLAVGNTAVCKPSEITPMSAYVLAQIMSEAGLPPGVCNFVFGTGEKAGRPLVQHPGVPLISFTGGTETGARIQNLVSAQFKRVSLELGGKNANIILNDADIERAVDMTLRSSFLNSGQVCLSGSRILIQNDIYKDFMGLFVQKARELVVGDPKNKETFMGPVVSQGQKEKVLAAIEQARGENGRVTLGGSVPTNLPQRCAKGYYVAPTIIEDLTNCSDLWLREVFGPVVTTMSFKYPHDAVKWANTSPYGLSASLWTRDVTRAHKMAAQIQAGTVWVNTWSLRDVAMPFGGQKASGLGREGGEESLRSYSETKTVCVALPQ